uniref:Major sperm protein n=1 Tax=Angiostrongylus cantonensis TaxID=6313 RepID=A0A158P9L5_ANGCA
MNIEDLAKDGEKGKPLKKKGYDDVEISDLSGGDSVKEGKEKKKGDKKAKPSDDKKDGDNKKEDKDKGASPSKTKKLSGEGKDGEKEKEAEKGEKKDGDGAKSAGRGPKPEKSAIYQKGTSWIDIVGDEVVDHLNRLTWFVFLYSMIAASLLGNRLL